MKRTLIVFSLLLSLAAHARLITESDILKFVWIGDPQVAPDGTSVAFVRVNVDAKGTGYESAIWMLDLRAPGDPRRVTNGPRDSAPRWSPDGKTLAFLRSVEKDGRPQPGQIHLLSMSGGEPRALTSMPKPVDSIVWSPDGKRIAFTATTRPSDFEKKADDAEPESDVRVINQAVYRFNGAGYADPTRASHVWVIDAAHDAKPKQLTTGEFDERDPQWSPDGARIFFTSNRNPESYYDRFGASIYSVASAGGEMTQVVRIDGAVQAYALSPDGKQIAFSGTFGEPVHSYTQTELFVAGIGAPDPARNLTGAYDYEILAGLAGDQRAPRGGGRVVPNWSSDGRSILVTSTEQGRANLIEIDAASGKITPITRANHEVQGFSRRGGRLVALVATPTHIGDLFSVDRTGTLTRLTRINDALLRDVTLTEPDDVWYTSFDGRKVQTWVQKPPDFDPSKKYPLILNIHGGPHAAYGYTFMHEFQWMAAKGYVVVYPNPRGSTSYGAEFGNLIQHRYPGDDHKDLMAAVDAVIEKGYIDTGKLGITGGSGGGVLTNWAITQTNRFKAAVSQRSIADWANFWYTADFVLFHPSWFRKAPWEDPEDFTQRSPLTHVAKITTPLMLIEGETDLRTPPTAGGETLFRALKYLKRPTVMVRFPDETHELSRSGKPRHRIERLQHIVGWFDKWLLGKGGEIYDAGLRQ